MKCKDCEHFHICYEPAKGVDTGLAECRKHGLVVDFLTHKKLERLECVEASFNCSAPSCLDCERNDKCNHIGLFKEASE